MSKEISRPSVMIQNVFVWLLLSLFVVLSTLLVTIGAGVYREAVDEAESHSSGRIVDTIVRNAVWTGDGNSTFAVEDDDQTGIRALVITTVYDDEAYARRLFVADGWLKESFTSAETPFSVNAGENLCELKQFDPQMENGILTVKTRNQDDRERVIRVSVRTGGTAQ